MKSKFILGEEWIYYKLYCGKKVSDIILVEALKPLVEELVENEIIEKWFFIRYKDPNYHIRVRFHCKDVSKLGVVIEAFKNKMKYYVDSDIIWKVQSDTYQREISRYGENTITEAEDFFYYDSTACLTVLDLIKEDELLFLFMLRSMDSLLSVFDFDLENKVLFSKRNLEYYREEFNADKVLSKQLNTKYKKLKDKLETFMLLEEHNDYSVLFNIIKEKEEKINNLKNKILKRYNSGELEVSLDNLLSSYLHMMLNRHFRDKQRLFELVSYHFMFRYYNNTFAKTLNR